MNPSRIARACCLVAVVSLVVTSVALGQGRPRRPEHDLLTYELVYQLPAMNQVVVERDVPYKTVSGRTLAVNLHYPPGDTKGKLLPAVLFVNGVGDRPDSKLSDWGQYRSWPRLVAARGMIGISMEARDGAANAEDVRDALRWARQQARTKGIDGARVAAWACSANAAAAVPVLMAEGEAPARAAVLYYGGGEAPSFRGDLPVLLVRAGRDQQFTQERIQRTLESALAANAPWTLVNLPDARHGFDCLDDNDEARRGVMRTLTFLEDELTAATPGPLPPPAAARPDPAHPPAEARAAMAHYFAREWDDAEQAYTAWLAKHPDDADALSLLGSAQFEAKRYDAARATLKRAIELSPDNVENYASLGKIEAGARNYAAAVPLLEKAIAASPQDPDAHYQLGGVYLAQQRYPDAVKELEFAVSLAPGNGWAWNKLGVACLAVNQPERAVESFEKVLVYAPNDPSLLYNLACAQARAGRPNDALDSLTRSVDNGYQDRKNLVADNDLASLRDEPRFAELVRRIPDQPAAH